MQRLLDLRGGEQHGQAALGLLGHQRRRSRPWRRRRCRGWARRAAAPAGRSAAPCRCTTFCWLPPLSEPIGASGPAVLTVTSRIIAVDARRARARARRTGRADEAPQRRQRQVLRRPTSSARARRAGGPRAPARARARCARRSRSPRTARRRARISPDTGGEPAGERLQQFGAAGAHQAVDADDLAGAHVSDDAVDREPAGVGRVGDGAGRARVSSSSPSAGMRVREQVVLVAADHCSHDPVEVDVVGARPGDEPPVAQDDGVGRRSRAPPRDGARCRRSRRRSAVSSRMTRNSTSTSAALSAEVGSSMIRTRASCSERPGDLDDLLLAEAQLLDQRVAGRGAPRGCASSARGGGALGAVDRPRPRRVISRAMKMLSATLRFGAEAELLVDDRDAAVGGVARRREARPARRRARARRWSGARSRRGSSSASTCRRRSRRTARSPWPGVTSKSTPRAARGWRRRPW